MTKSVKQALLDAANWLRENPERHITGTLAVNSNGNVCDPNDDDAQCFCALGRIAKEAELENDDEGSYDFLRKFIDKAPLPTLQSSEEIVGNIYMLNDRARSGHDDGVTPFCERGPMLSNGDVISLLLNLAKRLPDDEPAN